MARSVADIVAAMRTNPKGLRFTEARKVAEHYFGRFGKPRIAGSHHIYKTPWPGNPRINLQEDRSGSAKAYQVSQLLEAIDKLAVMPGPEQPSEGRPRGGAGKAKRHE
jgi:hypothetical protein